MDETLRALEKAAEAGDPEARAELFRAHQRAGSVAQALELLRRFPEEMTQELVRGLSWEEASQLSWS
ncbi:MAG: tetratricopeptide repeat protein [Planctomycetota bacterium]